MGRLLSKSPDTSNTFNLSRFVTKEKDVSDTTATASDVLSGKDFYLANGTKSSGTIETYSGSTTVTENGTIATNGKYMNSDISVNVQGGSNKLASILDRSVQTLGVDDFGGATKIGDNAFYGCLDLETLTLPEGVTTLGENSFRNCQLLHNVTLPSTITSIGVRAFAASTVNYLYIYATTPPTLANVNAINTNYILIIYIPQGTLSAYQSATNWSSLSSYFREMS